LNPKSKSLSINNILHSGSDDDDVDDSHSSSSSSAEFNGGGGHYGGPKSNFSNVKKEMTGGKQDLGGFGGARGMCSD
jgi:hypothetical protein